LGAFSSSESELSEELELLPEEPEPPDELEDGVDESTVGISLEGTEEDGCTGDISELLTNGR
jgi:hypothetical protein